MYLTEGDSWHHRPLHMEVLKYLRQENVAGAVAFHAIAGFQGRSSVQTAHFVEAGGDLPVVVSFVDTEEHVSRVLPRLREMAAHRLIVRENVVIEQGSSRLARRPRGGGFPIHRTFIVRARPGYRSRRAADTLITIRGCRMMFTGWQFCSAADVRPSPPSHWVRKIEGAHATANFRRIRFLRRHGRPGPQKNLSRLAKHGEGRQLDVPVIGVAKSGWTVEQLRERARDSVTKYGGGVDRRGLSQALRSCSATLTAITRTTRPTPHCARKLGEAQFPTHYLAIPPSMFPVVVQGLAELRLRQECARDPGEALRPRPGFGAQAQRHACIRHFPKTTSSASIITWAKRRWRTC